MSEFITVCCVCGVEMNRKQVEGREEAVLYSHGYCPKCEIGVKAELAALKAKLERGEI
jgi:Zn-finger nucleic acid-binding protein